MVAECAIIVEEFVALEYVYSAIKELIDDTAKRHIILVSEWMPMMMMMTIFMSTGVHYGFMFYPFPKKYYDSTKIKIFKPTLVFCLIEDNCQKSFIFSKI